MNQRTHTHIYIYVLCPVHDFSTAFTTSEQMNDLGEVHSFVYGSCPLPYKVLNEDQHLLDLIDSSP